MTAKLYGAKKSVGVERYVLLAAAVPVTFFLNTGSSTFFRMRSSASLMNVFKSATKVVSAVSQ